MRKRVRQALRAFVDMFREASVTLRLGNAPSLGFVSVGEELDPLAPYSEAASQLVISAWLHRIVHAALAPLRGDGNAEIEARPAGVAAIDREYAVGRGRVDLLVRWPLPAAAGGGVQSFAAEIKVRRDKDGDPLDEGLEQLSEYLDRLGLGEGTLSLFDQRSDAPPVTERCSRRKQVYGGCRIIVLRL